MKTKSKTQKEIHHHHYKTQTTETKKENVLAGLSLLPLVDNVWRQSSDLRPSIPTSRK